MGKQVLYIHQRTEEGHRGERRRKEWEKLEGRERGGWRENLWCYASLLTSLILVAVAVSLLCNPTIRSVLRSEESSSFYGEELKRQLRALQRTAQELQSSSEAFQGGSKTQLSSSAFLPASVLRDGDFARRDRDKRTSSSESMVEGGDSAMRVGEGGDLVEEGASKHEGYANRGEGDRNAFSHYATRRGDSSRQERSSRKASDGSAVSHSLDESFKHGSLKSSHYYWKHVNGGYVRQEIGQESHQDQEEKQKHKQEDKYVWAQNDDSGGLRRVLAERVGGVLTPFQKGMLRMLSRREGGNMEGSAAKRRSWDEGHSTMTSSGTEREGALKSLRDPGRTGEDDGAPVLREKVGHNLAANERGIASETFDGKAEAGLTVKEEEGVLQSAVRLLGNLSAMIQRGKGDARQRQEEKSVRAAVLQELGDMKWQTKHASKTFLSRESHELSSGERGDAPRESLSRKSSGLSEEREGIAGYASTSPTEQVPWSDSETYGSGVEEENRTSKRRAGRRWREDGRDVEVKRGGSERERGRRSVEGRLDRGRGRRGLVPLRISIRASDIEGGVHVGDRGHVEGRGEGVEGNFQSAMRRLTDLVRSLDVYKTATVSDPLSRFVGKGAHDAVGDELQRGVGGQMVGKPLSGGSETNTSGDENDERMVVGAFQRHRGGKRGKSLGQVSDRETGMGVSGGRVGEKGIHVLMSVRDFERLERSNAEQGRQTLARQHSQESQILTKNGFSSPNAAESSPSSRIHLSASASVTHTKEDVSPLEVYPWPQPSNAVGNVSQRSQGRFLLAPMEKEFSNKLDSPGGTSGLKSVWVSENVWPRGVEKALGTVDRILKESERVAAKASST